MESEQREIMNKQLLTLSILILATTSPKAAFGGPHDQDEADIRNVETRQQEAWNRHDAKAYAALFTEDADLVNVVGWRWKARAEIEKKLTDAYVFVFRESVLTVREVDVKFAGSRDCGSTHSLDYGWSQDPKRASRTSTRHSDSGPAKAVGQVVDCRVPKY